MSDWAVDTNVPVVANGRNTDAAPSCRLASIKALADLLDDDHRIVIDFDGEILAEYKRYLNPRGQPGVGDRFLQAILTGNQEKIVRVALAKSDDGEFVDFPTIPGLETFDLSDRKFVAAARVANAQVLNATDTDWWYARALLAEIGLVIVFVCGSDPAAWLA